MSQRPTRSPRGKKSVMAEPFPEPADDAPFAVGGVVENLPWDSYILRGALDTAAQLRLVDRIASLAGYASERWPERAAGQDHPAIVASHATGAVERPRNADARAAWRGAAGTAGDVGALYARLDDVFDLARDIAARIERQRGASAGASSHDPIAFDATHFWSLVYGDRTPGRRHEKRRSESGDTAGGGGGVAGGAAPGRNCGRMQSHLDRPIGWTLSLSVGRAVTFNLGRHPTPGSMYESSTNFANAAPGQGGMGVDVVLRSGDAALFRGHAVFHAVDGFADEEPPGVDGYGMTRGAPNGEGISFSAPEGWASRLLAPSRCEPPRDGGHPRDSRCCSGTKRTRGSWRRRARERFERAERGV